MRRRRERGVKSVTIATSDTCAAVYCRASAVKDARMIRCLPTRIQFESPEAEISGHALSEVNNALPSPTKYVGSYPGVPWKPRLDPVGFSLLPWHNDFGHCGDGVSRTLKRRRCYHCCPCLVLRWARDWRLWIEERLRFPWVRIPVTIFLRAWEWSGRAFVLEFTRAGWNLWVAAIRGTVVDLTVNIYTLSAVELPINLYIFYLVWSRQSQYVCSDKYRHQSSTRTPYIRPKTPFFFQILACLLMVFVAKGVLIVVSCRLATLTGQA